MRISILTEPAGSRLSVVDADRTDIDWLIATYIEAARDGHFDYDVADRDILRMIRANLRSIVFQRKMMDFGRKTRTLIFERDGVRIGACIMAQIIGQPSQVELHIMMVGPQHRHRGYGNRMLQEVISRWHADCDIMVRCYPVSGLMLGMLGRRGFMPCAEFDDGSVLYMLHREPPGWPAVDMMNRYTSVPA